MKYKKNIFNIQANYNFLESLLLFLEGKFLHNFENLQILLPNRRSCRELKAIIAKKGKIQQIPKIKAILDISYEDFFQFLPNEDVQKIISELTEVKVLDDLDYLFFLSEKIRNQAVFGNLNFDQSFKSAIVLKDLFDEIEQEEIDLEKIKEIDDSNLAKHRQVTLQFLNEFLIHTKNLLLKDNIFTKASYQNFLINHFVNCLENQKLNSPIVIAGSTGSIGFGRKLIKAISNQENGFVILQNFKKEESAQENHPQFLLNRLINSLNCGDAEKISHQETLISQETRQDLLSLIMVNSADSIKWQNIKSTEFNRDLEENFLIIEAKNNIEEAKVVAQILQKNQQKKSAIIINDNNFANLVKLELERLNLNFNDGRSQSIFNSKLINLLILIFELGEKDFDSNILLSILKNPLCAFDLEVVAKFEIDILRKARLEKGLNGLRKSLKSNKKLSDFFNEFFSKINLNSSVASLIKSVENLTNKTWLELVNLEDSNEEIFYLFEKLKQQNYQIKSINDFKVILSQISYFSKGDAASKIQILSPIEARLLNFDLIIISSLNEGLFPQIAAENWLGKKIKKDLGIDKTLQKIGQNAHDFCNYLSNKKVVLTRPKSSNGTALIESPFLIKFKTLAKKLGAKINQGEDFFKIINDENLLPEIEIKPTMPKPPLNLRPEVFSITEISKLIANPYFIYCKKILQLKELDKIDYEAGYAEFGSFVHKALELFIKNPHENNFEKIFDEFFIAKDAKLIWWPKFEKIFADFLKQNLQFSNLENLVEERVESRIANILLRGKVDRVIIDEENFEIIDYKTGGMPTKKDIALGLEPQLTIAALILLENQLQSKEISSLSYWKLSSSGEGEIKKISKDKEEIKILIAAARQGLEKLFSYFQNQENGYPARDKLTFNEFKNLARIND